MISHQITNTAGGGMRKLRTAQASIYEVFATHELGRELRGMSEWLDEHVEVLEWVAEDLGCGGVKPTGRDGLSAETALRCGLLKQHRQLSYEELSFHLEDSGSFQAFARLSMGGWPKKSALQRAVSGIRPQTWERINAVLRESARKERVEPGERIRVDSTPSDTPIHRPSDNTLLWDGVRVGVRLLERAGELPGAPALYYVNHARVAKKRARAIEYARGGQRREPLYRELLKVSRATLGYLRGVEETLRHAGLWGIELEGWLAQVRHYRPLIEAVISQTERRVFHGERVAASDKVLSLFEPHTDLIKKGERELHYGHKLNLVSGRSALILDVVVEGGNPVDSQRFLPLLERHIAHYGKAPRQVAADGGYASKDNLEQAKSRGVEDVAFHKRRGLSVEAMVKSQWVYRRLRNFRAGIEAGISCLKRAYGLGRCTWKGWEHFQAYVWSAVFAYNLALFARLRPT